MFGFEKLFDLILENVNDEDLLNQNACEAVTSKCSQDLGFKDGCEQDALLIDCMVDVQKYGFAAGAQLALSLCNNGGSPAVQIVNDNHGIIGNTNAPVTVYNGTDKALTAQEVCLLDMFSQMDVVKQSQLLAYAAELKKQ